MTFKVDERYKELAVDREPYLLRARACAALTQPAVCPPLGQSPANVLPQTYSSFGSRGVSNLGSKLMMALLPPGDSSFNLNVSVEVLMQEGVLSPPPEIIKGLAQCEKLMNTKIEALGWRRATFISLVHLIVNGNVVEYIQPDGRIKLFRLDQFVCVRDWSGTVLEIITAETMRVRALPEELKTLPDNKDESATVTLFTRFERLSDTQYAVSQNLDTHVVKARMVHDGLMPANALAWELVPGETYGRSHVEANYADLLGLDNTAQQLRESGAVAARNLIFVAPNAAGGNLRKRIAEARNGAVLSGRGGANGDVHPFQFENSVQMQVMQAEKADLIRGLSEAFLMTGGLRRDAERVTAYELQMLAQEIEASLGGTYSLLGVEMLGWRMQKLLAQMKAKRELPDLGNGVDITITTGLEALGKDAKVKRVRNFFGLLNETPQAFQEQAAQYVKYDTILTPAAAAMGFPESIRTQAEVAAEQEKQQQAAMQQAMVEKATAPVATAMAQGAATPQA